MSDGEGRKPSNQDIELVKNYIEWCIQNYMNKKEAIDTLTIQGKIEPRFTELVWERLEKENQEFFKAYYTKLLVKDQIMEFNKLLSEQVKLMHQSGFTGIASGLASNGSHVLSTQQISTPSAAQITRPLKTEDMQQLNVLHNYGSSIQSCARGTFDQSARGTFDQFVHSRGVDASSNMFLSQNPNMGLAQPMNGQIVRTDAGRSPFNFNPPSNFLESRPLMGDASAPPFSSAQSNAHPNDFLMDLDAFFSEQYQQTFTPEFTPDFADLLDGFKPPS